MGKIEKAVQWALAIAADDAHGYDQAKRQGPDYDCSSLIINAYEQAGVPVKAAGAGYTGNMRKAFIKAGFADITKHINLATGAGLMRGDVCLKEGSHVVLYIGGGSIVHASINEKGKTTGGQPGDQTGKEIGIRPYYNKPWNCVLRYAEEAETIDVHAGTATREPDKNPYTLRSRLMKKGAKGESVRWLQWELIDRGHLEVVADGDFGPITKAALIEVQKELFPDEPAEWDGEAGVKTLAALQK